MNDASRGVHEVQKKLRWLKAFILPLQEWSESKSGERFLQQAAKAAGKNDKYSSLTIDDFAVYHLDTESISVDTQKSILKGNMSELPEKTKRKLTKHNIPSEIATLPDGSSVLLVPKNYEKQANMLFSTARPDSLKQPDAKTVTLFETSENQAHAITQKLSKEGIACSITTNPVTGRAVIAVDNIMQHQASRVIQESTEPTKLTTRDFMRENCGKNITKFDNLTKKECQAITDCLKGSHLGYTIRSDGKSFSALTSKEPDRVAGAVRIAKLRTSKLHCKQPLEDLLHRANAHLSGQDFDAAVENIQKTFAEKESPTDRDICEALNLPPNAQNLNVAQAFLDEFSEKDQKALKKMHEYNTDKKNAPTVAMVRVDDLSLEDIKDALNNEKEGPDEDIVPGQLPNNDTPAVEV